MLVCRVRAALPMDAMGSAVVPHCRRRLPSLDSVCPQLCREQRLPEYCPLDSGDSKDRSLPSRPHMWRLNKNDTVSGIENGLGKMLWQGGGLGSGRRVGRAGGTAVSRVPPPAGHGPPHPPGCFSRYDSNSGGEREIQLNVLELLNQLGPGLTRGRQRHGHKPDRDLDRPSRPGHAAPASGRAPGSSAQGAVGRIGHQGDELTNTAVKPEVTYQNCVPLREY